MTLNGGWNSYPSNYIWSTTTSSATTSWTSPGIVIGDAPVAAPKLKKKSAVDWLADEVERICALTREPVSA